MDKKDKVFSKDTNMMMDMLEKEQRESSGVEKVVPAEEIIEEDDEKKKETSYFQGLTNYFRKG